MQTRAFLSSVVLISTQCIRHLLMTLIVHAAPTGCSFSLATFLHKIPQHGGLCLAICAIHIHTDLLVSTSRLLHLILQAQHAIGSRPLVMTCGGPEMISCARTC